MRCVRGSWTISVIAIATVLAGCGDRHASVVSAEKYMTSVCGAIGPWVRDINMRSGALGPTVVSDPAQRKKVAQQFLRAVVIDTDQVLSRLKAAGTPGVKGGKGAAGGLIDVFTQLRKAFAQATSQAASLPTGSAREYNTAAQQLRGSIRSSTASIRAGLDVLRNPDLQKAAAKQRACQSAGA
jgi:hypothetical protein